jgi:hypothetical protein
MLGLGAYLHWTGQDIRGHLLIRLVPEWIFVPLYQIDVSSYGKVLELTSVWWRTLRQRSGKSTSPLLCQYFPVRGNTCCVTSVHVRVCLHGGSSGQTEDKVAPKMGVPQVISREGNHPPGVPFFLSRSHLGLGSQLTNWFGGGEPLATCHTWVSDHVPALTPYFGSGWEVSHFVWEIS